MSSFFKIKPEHKKHVRTVVGIIILILGGIFMLVPFIPLGYVFLFGGLFLLSTKVPIFKKWLDKAKSKDKKGKIEKVEKMVDEKEEQLTEKIVESND